jgi:hypothetical protein
MNELGRETDVFHWILGVEENHLFTEIAYLPNRKKVKQKSALILMPVVIITP